MIKVSIHSPTLREQPYTDKKTGERKVLFFQTAYFHVFERDGSVAPYPEKVEIVAERDKATGNPLAYAAGPYQLHPSAIYVDGNGRLAVAPRLLAVKG